MIKIKKKKEKKLPQKVLHTKNIVETLKNQSGASHKIMKVKWLHDCFTYIPYNDMHINSPHFAVTKIIFTSVFDKCDCAFTLDR